MKKLYAFVKAHRVVGYRLISILMVILFVATCSFSMIENNIESVTVDGKSWESNAYSGYEIKNENGITKWVPVAGDPQIYLPSPTFAINCVKLIFDQPLVNKTYIQLYYAEEGEILQEQNSYRFQSDEGQTTLTFFIPEGAYATLRIDIDGEFSPEEIRLSKTEILPERNLEIVPLLTLLVLFVLLIVFNSKIGYFTHIKRNIAKIYVQVKASYKEHKWIELIFYFAMCISTAVYAIVLLVLLLFSYLTVKSITFMFWLTVITIAFQLLYRVYSNRNAEPAKLFLVIALLVGFLFAYALPITTGIAWDDQIHYYRTELTSRFLFGHQRTFADYAQAVIVHPSYEAVDEFEETLHSMVWMDQQEYDLKGHMVNFYGYAAYLHNSFLIFLSDIFSIDIILQMMIMKMANVSIYAFVIYCGIRKLKSGAYLASAICLMPTAMFLASTINYDWWVTCFLVYAFSSLISELQQPEKKLSFKDTAWMLGAMFVGCGPKAIYFLLLIPFLFLSKKKFYRESDYKKYGRTCIVLVAVIMLSFVLPFLISTDSATDLRGGSDVNSSEQIKFILTSPFQYAKILVQFMIGYLSPQNALSSSNFLAYLGGADGIFAIIAVGVIVFCAFVDKKDCDSFKYAGRFNLVTFMTVLIDVALIATALYISFTPVRYETINGCQWRYLIPLLFPLFYSLGGRCAVRTMSDRKMSVIVFGLLSVALIGSFYSVYVSALIM